MIRSAYVVHAMLTASRPPRLRDFWTTLTPRCLSAPVRVVFK